MTEGDGETLWRRKGRKHELAIDSRQRRVQGELVELTFRYRWRGVERNEDVWPI